MTSDHHELGDHCGLVELYARYTHAFDENRPDELAALFTDDGEFLRPGAPPVRGAEALAAMVRASAARGTGNRHLVSAVVVEVSSDTATGRAYVQVVSVAEDGVRPIAIGRYDDAFARDGGLWRIRSRRFTPFTGAPPAHGS